MQAVGSRGQLTEVSNWKKWEKRGKVQKANRLGSLQHAAPSSRWILQALAKLIWEKCLWWISEDLEPSRSKMGKRPHCKLIFHRRMALQVLCKMEVLHDVQLNLWGLPFYGMQFDCPIQTQAPPLPQPCVYNESISHFAWGLRVGHAALTSFRPVCQGFRSKLLKICKSDFGTDRHGLCKVMVTCPKQQVAMRLCSWNAWAHLEFPDIPGPASMLAWSYFCQ